jgi:deoxycytidine triphosphate deaminase
MYRDFKEVMSLLRLCGKTPLINFSSKENFMSLLTDTDLNKILNTELGEATEDSLTIYPYSKDSLTPVGYDLRVGKTIANSDRLGRKTLSEGDCFTISPGSTALITTLENISMPKKRSISGLIESKVSKVSRGLSHISTTVDPDWNGNLLIAIHNHSSEKIKLTYGEAFCTIIFIANQSPSTKVCNKQPGRLDVLMEKFDQENARATKRRIFKEVLPPIIVLIAGALGYFIFGNSPGFAALVAIGTAISQYVAAKLK